MRAASKWSESRSVKSDFATQQVYTVHGILQPPHIQKPDKNATGKLQANISKDSCKIP